MSIRIPADTTSVNIKLKASHRGFEKKDGVKSDRPLIDAETSKRIHWLNGAVFPTKSTGGDDIDIFIKCLSDDDPLVLRAGERPLVELVNPSVEITERGISLVCEGVKAIKAVK